MIHNTITVWSYLFCPREILQYIDNRDDIDWIALIPPCYKEEGWNPSYTIPWLDHLGCCEVLEYKHPEGTLYVGYHA